MLPVIDSLKELEQALDETAQAMDKLAESGRSLFRDYLRDNFYLQNNVYIHHSRERALNSLSKEVTVTDYCLTQAPGIPLLLLLAEETMDEFSREKMQLFQDSQPEAHVHVIEGGYHFLPITNPGEVAEVMESVLGAALRPDLKTIK